LPFNIPTSKPSNLQTTNLDAASSISPLFVTLIENTRSGGYIFQSKFFSFRSLTTRHPLLSTISFKIRTYEKTPGGWVPRCAPPRAPPPRTQR
jgi:hypothetical protein